MADNVQLNTGAGGDVVAADDISGVKHQRVKVQFGADGVALDVDATTNRLPTAALGYGQQDDATNVVLRASDDRALIIETYGEAVGKGQLSTAAALNVFGRTPKINDVHESSISSESAHIPLYQDVWNGAGHYTGQPEEGTFSDQSVEVLSSSAEDDSGGMGAHTVRIEGLDENWEIQTETLALNGITPAASGNNYVRITKFEVVTAGANERAVGQLTCRHANDEENIFAIIEAGGTKSHACVGTVPSGHDGSLMGLELLYAVDAGAAGHANVTLMVRPSGEVWQEYKPYKIISGSGVYFKYSMPETFAAKTDFKVRVNDVSVDLSEVTAAMELLFESTS